MSLKPHKVIDGAGLFDRVAPDHVVRGLRDTDPMSDLFYLGNGRWLHVVLKPENSERRRIAYNLLRQLDEAILNGSPSEKMALNRRARFARIAYAGYSPVKQYDIIGAPTLAIAKDFHANDWAYKHQSQSEAFNSIADPNAQAKADARAELSSMHNDVWKYAFTRSHAVTRMEPQDVVHTGVTRYTTNQAA